MHNYLLRQPLHSSHRCIGALMCAALVLLNVSFAKDTRGDETKEAAMPLEQSSWRTPPNCGPNALYAMMKLHGIDVTLAEVVQLAPPGENGVSFAALRAASGKLGLTARIIKAAPDELTGIPMPAIAHLSGLRDGHFVVLLNANGKSVVVADLVACTIKRVSLDRFKKDWSGYLLVHSTGIIESSSFWLLASGATLMVISLAWTWTGRRNRQELDAVEAHASRQVRG